MYTVLLRDGFSFATSSSRMTPRTMRMHPTPVAASPSASSSFLPFQMSRRNTASSSFRDAGKWPWPANARSRPHHDHDPVASTGPSIAPRYAASRTAPEPRGTASRQQGPCPRAPAPAAASASAPPAAEAGFL